MAFMITDYTFRANVSLIILTPVFSLLLWMLGTEFFSLQFFTCCLVFHVLLLFFAVQIIKNCEVFDKLLNIRREILTACRTRKYVRGAQVHETMLTECVAAGQDTWDFLFVVVMIVTNWTIYFHVFFASTEAPFLSTKL